MSNVVRMPTLVAWAPTSDEEGALLSAILCHPQQSLEPYLYLSLLGNRIQTMVDRCDDPQEATNRLQSDLFRMGLYPDEAHVPAEKAGNHLIWSNPGVQFRLSERRLLPNQDQRPGELPAAREQINADRYDPGSRLESWASELERLP